MKYKNLDLGIIEAVFNKLGGIKGAKDFLSNKIQVVKISEKICFKVWNKVTIGTFKNIKELYNAIIISPVRVINNFAGFLSCGMDVIVEEVNPTLSPVKMEKKLVSVSYSDLGIKCRFWDSISLKEIRAKVTENGLEFCSEEIPFQLALQVQVKRESKNKLYILTKTERTFCLSWSKGEVFFSYYDYRPTTIFDKNDKFILCVPE